MDRWIVIFVLLSIAGWAYNRSSYNRDSTGPEGGRSGLKIYTGAATGVQYVGGGFFGGVTPRIDRDGKPFAKE